CALVSDELGGGDSRPRRGAGGAGGGGDRARRGGSAPVVPRRGGDGEPTGVHRQSAVRGRVGGSRGAPAQRRRAAPKAAVLGEHRGRRCRGAVCDCFEGRVQETTGGVGRGEWDAPSRPRLFGAEVVEGK